MQKTKLKFSSVLLIIKCVLIGIVSTLIGIVIFSVVLKFANFSNLIISYVNDVIKAFSIFIMIMCLKKQSDGKTFIKSIFVWCSSCVPCEKLSLATFIPAWQSSVNDFSVEQAGPIVQMIFVFLLMFIFLPLYWLIINIS